MAHRRVLSLAQLTDLSALPTERPELAKHYLITDSDLTLITKRRGAPNRLGFAIQLCLMRHPCRRLDPSEKLPRSFVAFIADQIDADPNAIEEYASRPPTAREHFAELAAHFGVRRFKLSHYRSMIRWLVPLAIERPQAVMLAGGLLNELRRQRILRPRMAVVERVLAAAMMRADKQVVRSIHNRLSADQQSRLDDWLKNQPSLNQSRFSWVRQPIGRPCPANVLEILKRTSDIDSLELCSKLTNDTPSVRVDRLHREGVRISVGNLAQLTDNGRRALIVVTLQQIRRRLIDEAITMHDRIVGSLVAKSKRRHAADLQDKTKLIRTSIDAFAKLGRAILLARQHNTDMVAAIEAVASWDDLTASIESAESLGGPKKLNHLRFVDAQYGQIRRYAPKLLNYLVFQGGPAGRDVLDAVGILRELNRSGKRQVPSHAPTSFVQQQWRPFVGSGTNLNRRYYELAVLGELRNRLRSGDIWVPGSRQYRDFDQYLMAPTTFEQMRKDDTLPLDAPLDVAAHLRERQELMSERMSEVHSLVEERPDIVEIRDGRFCPKPHRATTIPKEAKRLLRDAYDMLPRIRITDLLVEVDQWTGFSSQFTHVRSGQPAEDRESLLTVILANGINLGLTRMARACRGASLRQLSWISDWYVTQDAYERALADMVNYHHGLDLVGAWGDGTTSSSDGQMFPLGSVARPLGTINPKYGSQPGVTFYTHISDQYAPFHTQLISSSTRDATYVLDGLLYHQSDLEIREHYTDTAGFTDHVFALCHLLGFRFAPRLRDIGDLSIYPLGSTAKWPLLADVFGSQINSREVTRQWDEVLRLVSSIRLGTVTASLIIKKLAAYPRQNRLALALRELGRLERSIFILDWMRSPELRGTVQAGLNKGEARNALSRTIYFNRLGEIRDRSFESQCNRASGLNLVVAAVVLWNTVHLERVLDELRAKGREVEKYKSYLSPLGWGHIALTGDYIWPRHR